jgi:ATP/maltotriose-dependent transcriptional regulator MalT
VSLGKALVDGKDAFGRRRWAEAHRCLSAADAESVLGADDLERLAVAAYLIGRDSDAVGAFKRAHRQLADLGQRERAARCTFWVCIALMLGGEGAQARGWLSRTQRMLKDHPGCAEHGLMCIVAGLFPMFEGKPAEAIEYFEQASECAERFPDDDLLAFSLLARGQALIRGAQPTDGASYLDEAMVTVTTGQVSPMTAGIVYCAVILETQRIFDLARAKEWTSALAEWCATQPEMMQFQGACLIHRSEILQLQGEWPAAIEAAQRSCSWYSGRSESVGGRAFYQLAELHRLKGEFELAEHAYRDAGRSGKEPQPGMSLLRLMRGDLDAAVASIQRVVGEVGGQKPGAEHAAVLAAYVEIMLAGRQLQAARAGAKALEDLAVAVDAPPLRALAAHALGAVALADGDATDALTSLRKAWAIWQQLDAPYEAARVRALIADACAMLGDSDTAVIHRDAARSVFERLGAQPALCRLDQGSARGSAPAAQLTARELEVLALLAAGKTNRQIGAELFISEHTVARHLSNVFNKIDVTTRTAAVAFALENRLV